MDALDLLPRDLWTHQPLIITSAALRSALYAICDEEGAARDLGLGRT